jgi:hypothetical protein
VVWALASGSVGALLVSPFNVKWGCYAWAESVEESKFCKVFFIYYFYVFIPFSKLYQSELPILL